MTRMRNSGYFLILSVGVVLLGACGSEIGGDEDNTAGTVTLTSLSDGNNGEDVVGTFIITWENTEPNRSTVDIDLSSDSGGNYDTTIELKAPDTGKYVWDTNTVTDCRKCRIRITATDIARNVSGSVASTVDFVINNVPQVLGSALFYDAGNDGVGNGDEVIIPFDKDIELLTSMVSNVFTTPVVADEIGPFSTMALGGADNELVITINDLVGSDFHLHLAGSFDSDRVNRTAPSGLDILDNIPGDLIFATDTGRTAEPLGDGIDIAPTFNEALGVAIASNNTVGLALGYLDNNATLDAVVINDNNTGIQSVYSNDDSGTFSPFPAGVQALGGMNNTSVAVGDLDGANGPDIVVGNTDGSIVYFNNNNDGDFIAPPVTLSGSNAQAVVLGNIDSDDDLELITGTNGVIRVWDSIGSGNLMLTAQALGAFDTHALALGRIDNNEELDLVAGNSSGQANRVYLDIGSQTGDLIDTGQEVGIGDTYSIALGDFNNDGDLDIFFGNNGQANEIWFGDGAGWFTNSEQALGNGNTRAVAAGDYDDDGDIDLAVGDLGTPLLLWFNDGVGVFTTGLTLGGNILTQSIVMADIDSDGDYDLLEGLFGSATRVWKNSLRYGTRFVDSDQSHGDKNTNDVALGDIDGDGDLDYVSANVDQGNRVYINDEGATNSKGVYTDSGQSLGTYATKAITLGDIDNDRDLDIITANDSAQGNSIWLNNDVNSGTFSEALPSLGGSDSLSLVLGDVDNDGDLDLITGNLGQENKVWTNNGPGAGIGTFIDSGQISVFTNDTTSVLLGNIDSDDDLDLVTGNEGQGNRVYRNDGNHSGTFVDSAQSLGTYNTTSLDLGDVDGDGDLDLVTGNFNQHNRVYLNGGDNTGSNTGVFVDSNQILGSYPTRSIKLFDVDKDGDLDVVAGISSQRNIINLNRGDGIFSNEKQIGVSTDLDATNNTFSLETGDVDGDGDIDIVEGNAVLDGNRLWLNDN